MTAHLAQLRDSLASISGRTIAASSTDWLLSVGPWQLTLQIPHDPYYKPEPEEVPADAYVGIVVRLMHRSTLVATDSVWGIGEDLAAGQSTNHPFWQHVAGWVRDLASEMLEPNHLSRILASKRASLDAMAADVAALTETGAAS